MKANAPATLALLALFAFLAFLNGVALPASAQESGRALSYRTLPMPAEVEHVVFDWSTGRVASRTRIQLGSVLPSTQTVGLPPTPCFGYDVMQFGNETSGGIFGVPDLVGDEIVDWGVKNCGQSTIVTSLTTMYCSEAADATLGGPGAALTFTLYADTNGFGDLGTELRRFELSGLPGRVHTLYTHYLLTIDMTRSPLCIPDGNIGWSFMNVDDQSGPLLVRASPALGTRDALDVYRPGPATLGNYLGTFNYGLLPGYASYLLALNEEVVLGSGVAIANGNDVNPLRFESMNDPRLGRAWLSRISAVSSPPVVSTAVAISIAPLAPLATPLGELLIDLRQPVKTIDFGLGLHSVVIPKDASLLGTTLHAQAALFRNDGTCQLMNGLDLTIGT